MNTETAYTSFCDEVLNKLNQKLQNCSVNRIAEIKPVVCRNDVVKEVITFHHQDGIKKSPVIYLKDFYRKSENENIDDIVDEIFRIMIANSDHLEKSHLEDILTHDGVRDLVSYRLVNRGLNEAYLKDKVFRPFLDLAILYQLYVEIGEETGQIVITQDLAEKLEYTETELYELAAVNSPKLYPPRIVGIREMLGIQDMDEFRDGAVDEIQVITNTNTMYGASVLLYPGLIQGIYNQYGDRYILPSSLHETLLVGTTADPKQYLDMVRDVNSSVVDDEDVLSNSVYKITRDGLIQEVFAA